MFAWFKIDSGLRNLLPSGANVCLVKLCMALYKLASTVSNTFLMLKAYNAVFAITWCKHARYSAKHNLYGRCRFFIWEHMQFSSTRTETLRLIYMKVCSIDYVDYA